MRVAVIRNPFSGRGAGEAAWSGVEEQLRQALGSRLVSIEATKAAGTGKTQARELARAGIEIIVGAGGDGTITDVMQGVLGTDSALALIPQGTGNDFSRTLGIGTDLARAVQTIANGNIQSVDVGHWQQECAEGHFLNVAGCGFDSMVADRINHGYRKLSGKSAYLAAMVGTLMSYRPSELTITVDGDLISQRAMLCAIANAQSYGGGMKVAPTASITDGLLDLVLVGEFGRIEFLRAFPRVLKGTHLTHPKVTHRQFRELEITSEPAIPFLVDGELVGAMTTRVTVLPGSLRLVIPA
jgi:diacylglycerol kinase (ATP)